MSFFGALLALGMGSLHAAPTYSSQITASAEYSAGSGEGAQIQQWLLQQGAPHAPGVTMRFSKSDRFTITRTTLTRSTRIAAAAASPGDGPPVPLPTSGNPGDSISITHQSGGFIQTWVYEWFGSSTGGGWGLVRYTYERVRVGPAPG